MYIVADKSEFSEVTENSVSQILTDITEPSFLLIENSIKDLYLDLWSKLKIKVLLKHPMILFIYFY